MKKAQIMAFETDDMITKKVFLKILFSYINQKPFESTEKIDWKKIVELAEIHSVQTIVYLAAGDKISDLDMHERLKYDFLISANNSISQEIAMEQVISKLTENSIDHMLMKGYVLRNYYPDKEARSFGDIDFLIKEEDREKSHRVIQDMGFEYDKDHFIKQVYTYKKKNIILEAHTEIIYNSYFLDFDYRTYFLDKVKNMELVKGHTYELKKEDHFIYVMVHLATHFYNAGIGVRMLLDIAVFLNKYGSVMDMDYICKEFEKIRLSKFVNIIYYLCGKYFATKVDCRPIAESEEKLIMGYILNHGTFGFWEKDVFDISYHNNNEGFWPSFRKRFFPEYERMIQRNAWFKNGKKYMLPYAWVRRWFDLIFNKKRRVGLGNKLNAVFSKGSDADKHTQILNIVGLK